MHAHAYHMWRKSVNLNQEYVSIKDPNQKYLRNNIWSDDFTFKKTLNTAWQEPYQLLRLQTFPRKFVYFNCKLSPEKLILNS